MPAQLVPNEAIPQLAAQMTSPAMLKMLRLLRDRGFIQNGPEMDEETAKALENLTALGLADAGYEGKAGGRPFIWVGNHNSERVLKHLDENRWARVLVQPRVRSALAALPPADRQAVHAAIEALLVSEPAAWPPEEVERISPDKPDYQLRVLPGLRAFIRTVEPHWIELFDLVPEETLRLFLERYRTGSKVG